MELKCTDPSSGGYYYPEHLPVLGEWYCPSVTVLCTCLAMCMYMSEFHTGFLVGGRGGTLGGPSPAPPSPLKLVKTQLCSRISNDNLAKLMKVVIDLHVSAVDINETLMYLKKRTAVLICNHLFNLLL